MLRLWGWVGVGLRVGVGGGRGIAGRRRRLAGVGARPGIRLGLRGRLRGRLGVIERRVFQGKGRIVHGFRGGRGFGRGGGRLGSGVARGA